ncbi:MAG TPA: solute carrier family 23 protein [Anaerolineaceae bacterium]|nr:solute carrier family 23 protein [Anaerolineaceae bacterium]
MAKKKEQDTKPAVIGYLPDDVPPLGKLVLLGFQHVLTMFPATVLAAMLMGFHVSTTLAVTGFATIVALIGSKLALGKFIPLYYGASFSYITAVVAFTGVSFGEVASDEALSLVQVGFIATGVINILVGLLIRRAGGKKFLDTLLPPIVTGSVACVIGVALAATALSQASGVSDGFAGGSGVYWTVAMVTMISAILYSVYLQGKGFIGLLPILLAAVTGYVFSIALDQISYLTSGATLGLVDFSRINAADVIRTPHITLPNFSHPDALTVIIGVGIMAIATIPESTAHLYQISLYVDHLADELGRPKYGLSRYIGLNLVLDGINDIINGFLGSPAGTNYGENNSLMVISRNYSGPALLMAGVIAILLGFFGPLSDLVSTIPTAVTGGLSIYLFGVIGMQGVALMISERVNLFDPRQLAIGAVIMIVGIGGAIGFPNGFLPVPGLGSLFPSGLPAIATAAVMGILLNLVFTLFKPSVERSEATKVLSVSEQTSTGD